MKPPKQCTCGLAKSLVGDGCSVCNPQMMIDILREQAKQDASDLLKALEERDEARAEVERLRKLINDKHSD